MRSVSVATSIDLFLAATREQVKPSTLAMYTYYLRRLAEAYGAMELRDVTPALAMKWATKWHPMIILQRLCRWATD